MARVGIEEILEHLLGLEYFHARDGVPAAIPMKYVPGTSRLCVVVGPNASGKSFFRRGLQAVTRLRDDSIEFMGVSMEKRTSGGPVVAFVFGAESWESTGAISARTVTTGISTCRNREKRHLVFWDEPDLGLSEGYAKSVGEKIAAFARDLPEKTVAAFVVTHSKAMVRQLLEVNPHYLHLGDENAPETLAAWVTQEEPMRDLDALKELAVTRLRAIQVILDKKSAKS